MDGPQSHQGKITKQTWRSWGSDSGKSIASNSLLGQQEGQAGAQTRHPQAPGQACLPPPWLSAGLEPRGFFFFFFKQSYLFTLISCLKNVNKITP